MLFFQLINISWQWLINSSTANSSCPGSTSQNKKKWYQRGLSIGNTLHLYLGGARFKFLPECQLFWLKFFMDFLSPSKWMPNNTDYFKIILPSSYHLRLKNLNNESIINNPQKKWRKEKLWFLNSVVIWIMQ